jgi:hypothetical protein
VNREDLRATRLDRREARREFRREFIRSGDVDLWVRRLAGGKADADDAEGGAITGTRGERIIALANLIRELAGGGSTSVEVNRNNQQRQLEIEIPGSDVQRTLKPNVDDPKVKEPADTRPELNPAPRPAPRSVPANPVAPLPRTP